MSFGKFKGKSTFQQRQSPQIKRSAEVEKAIHQVTSKSLFNDETKVLTTNKNISNQNVNNVKTKYNTPSPKQARTKIIKNNSENRTPKERTPTNKSYLRDKYLSSKLDQKFKNNVNESVSIKQATPNKTPIDKTNSGVSKPMPKRLSGNEEIKTASKNPDDISNTDAASSVPQLSEDQTSIKVAVRVRPFNRRELSSDASQIISMKKECTTIRNPSTNTYNEFTYDYSFWSFDNHTQDHVNQKYIFTKIGVPLLNYSFQGYNTCLFAYGQTGSGKSYTVMGYQDEDEGIVPRFSRNLFSKVKELEEDNKNISYSVEMSFFEIYNEKIFDLLEVNIDGGRQRLCVREHPDMGPYVQGLSLQVVRNMKDIQEWLEVGNKNRATAATGMNEKSSRSHSVFTITLTQIKNEIFDGTETNLQKTSKINLIDLAGSERAHQVYDDKFMKDSNTANTRLKEGSCINKSLHTLGKVISILSEKQTNPKKKYVYIPYRDSVLTWLLKESLGGNSKTVMLATISPADIHYSETLSTLRYANQARLIVNKARVNEDPKSKLIREMMVEIDRLKSCQDKTGDRGNALEKEVLLLREKLKETQGALASSTKNWQEKFEQSEKKQQEATKHLRRSGIAFTKLETQNPCLINLNEDAQLNEVLVYILHRGKTSVGSDEIVNNHHIKLWGDLIASHHCDIEYDGDCLLLTANELAATFVNGNQITDKVVLHHGDRLVIGGNHFFRLSHPKELTEASEKPESPQKRNYQYAKDELFKKQNERLYKELEEAKQDAEERAVKEIQKAKEDAKQELETQKTIFLEQQKLLENKLRQSADEKKQVEQSNQNAKEIIKNLKEEKKILEEKIKTREKTEVTERKKDTRSSLTILVNNKTKYIDLSLQQDLLALSLMTNEANSIFERDNQCLIFSREDLYLPDGNIEHQIRMTDYQNGRSTTMTLEVFGDILTHAKEHGATKIWELLDNEKFVWMNDNTCKRKARMSRLSISNASSISMNHSVDMTSMNSVHESTALSNPISSSRNSCMRNDLLKLSRIEDETLLQPSADLESPVKPLDLSNLKSNMFETFLNEDEDTEMSIIARLTTLIIHAQSDWTKLIQDGRQFQDGGQFANTTCIEDSEQALMRLACCMKTIRDLAYTLCKVHQAVGLDQLKEMSQSFKENIVQGCDIVKKYPVGLSKEEIERFDKILTFLVEVTAALSLSSIDHFPYENNEIYLSPEASNTLLTTNFLQCQNRFLIAMIDDAFCTVESSIDVIRDLILTRGHEISDDLLDGVMNILTSIMTLLQTCKDLLMVHYDMNSSTGHVTLYSKECYLLRQFLTAIVDYNEDIFSMVERSKEISKDCDNLDSFLEVPIELANTTKCICNTGKDLLVFVSQVKKLDEETLLLLQECYEKFEFAGKAVRVGVTIVAQEVEKDLNIAEENSILSIIQSDDSLARQKSLCPLNRTNLDVSQMSDNLRNSFGKQLNRSSMQSDKFISHYMDSTVLADD